MERELGFLVVAHLDVEVGRESGNPAPFGGATAPGGIEVADVDRPVHDQVPGAEPGVFTLPGRHRNAGHGADVLHPTAIVRPATGLLEPTEPDVRPVCRIRWPRASCSPDWRRT